MENDNKPQNKNVETLTDDIVKTLASDKEGLIKKVIHEEEKRDEQRLNLSPESNKNKFFIILSILLVSFSLIFLFFIKSQDGIFSVDLPVTPIIFIDRTDFQDVNELAKDRVKNPIFVRTQSTKVKIGGIEGIYLTKNQTVLNFSGLMEFVNSDLSTNDIAFFSDYFLFGVVRQDAGRHPFFLFEVNSFADIFPVMRRWENKILTNLHSFFGVELSVSTNYLFTKEWEDGFILNKNARILKNQNNNIVLMYVFIGDSYVVVADAEEAVEEIILRLFRSQIRK